MSDLNTLELVKILLQEREFHSTHPHEVAVKFHYWVGGAILTLFGSYFLKREATQGMSSIWAQRKASVIWSGIGVFVGYALVLWGLGEHDFYHVSQQRRLEVAIQELLVIGGTVPPSFWEQHGQVVFDGAGSPTPLIAYEPDKRSALFFHDLKIRAGGIMMSLSIIFLVYLSVSAIRQNSEAADT